MFSTEAIKHQQHVHQPGSFQPWIFCQREQFNRSVPIPNIVSLASYQKREFSAVANTPTQRRIAANIFKVDAYLTLLDDQTPQIRRDELDIRLTSPFTLWNAYDLHTYFSRKPRDPQDRNALSLAQLLRRPHGGLMSPSPLYDDMQALLLGVAHDVWEFAQVRRGGGPGGSCGIEAVEGNRQAMIVVTKLGLWREDLDSLGYVIDDPLMDPEAYHYLLWAYAASEREDNEESRKAVIGRIRMIRLNTIMLYHLVNMHLYADMRLLRDLLLLLHDNRPPLLAEESPQAAALHRQKESTVLSWTQSKDGRTALLHAIAATKVYDATPPDAWHDPCYFIALTNGAIVAEAWLSRSECPGGEHPEMDMGGFGREGESGPVQTGWLEHGGPVSIWGTRLCGCEEGRKGWARRVLGSLAVVKERWAWCEPVAAAVEAQLRNR